MVVAQQRAGLARLVSEQRNWSAHPWGQAQEPLKEGTLLLQPRLRFGVQLEGMAGGSPLEE